MLAGERSVSTDRRRRLIQIPHQVEDWFHPQGKMLNLMVKTPFPVVAVIEAFLRVRHRDGGGLLGAWAYAASGSSSLQRATAYRSESCRLYESLNLCREASLRHRA